MTDADALMFQAFVKKYGAYKVAVVFRQLVEVHPQSAFSLAKHRARQLEYACGVAEGKLKMLGEMLD